MPRPETVNKGGSDRTNTAERRSSSPTPTRTPTRLHTSLSTVCHGHQRQVAVLLHRPSRKCKLRRKSLPIPDTKTRTKPTMTSGMTIIEVRRNISCVLNLARGCNVRSQARPTGQARAKNSQGRTVAATTIVRDPPKDGDRPWTCQRLDRRQWHRRSRLRRVLPPCMHS